MTHDWFFGTIIFSVVGAFVWGYGAAVYHKDIAFPYLARSRWLIGTVKGTSKISITSGGAGLVASALSERLSDHGWFQSAMLGVLVVAIASAILSYFMGAALDAKTSADGEQINVDHKFWIALHGAVFGATLVSMVCTLIAVLCLGLELRG